MFPMFLQLEALYICLLRTNGYDTFFLYVMINIATVNNNTLWYRIDHKYCHRQKLLSCYARNIPIKTSTGWKPTKIHRSWSRQFIASARRILSVDHKNHQYNVQHHTSLCDATIEKHDQWAIELLRLEN